MDSSSAPPVHFRPPSALIRLAPLRLFEIPAHPDLPSKNNNNSVDTTAAATTTTTTTINNQPDLLPFIITLLNDGLTFLASPIFSKNFKHHSVKKASPSKADVEVLTYSIPTSNLKSQVPWAPAAAPASPSPPSSSSSSPGKKKSSGTNGNANANGTVTTRSSRTRAIKRQKPANLQPEHWFARRSIHTNISSKSANDPGHASWEEFIYGIRDNHSQHEQDFTPTLYDARKVVDWSGQVAKLEAEGSLARTGFSNVTIAIYEMCHEVPAPMKPRCFGVLVVTASVATNNAASGNNYNVNDGHEQEKFIAVTVPVHLGHAVKKAFYANWRNLKEGENEKQKRETVQALYCAVETCTLRKRKRTGGAENNKKDQKGANKEDQKSSDQQQQDKAEGEGGGQEEEEQEIDWLMATASDAKGVLPMWMQKLALPGTLPKDVSYFINWIKGVDDSVIDGGWDLQKTRWNG